MEGEQRMTRKRTLPFLRSLADGSCALTKKDWILFGILSVFCYVSFVQGDIFITGNRSWWLWDGPFTDFYERSYEITQGYGANYLPSTFILFAVWILPLKLLGFPVPQSVGESRILYNMWYKLLPVLFYLACAYLIYLVAKEIGMGARKAKICMFAFLTLPVAFYSQFIFSQYDSFTVFFVLLGLYYYFRNAPGDRWRFCLCFGVATTFKYFSALIFFALLLLDEKNVLRIIKNAIFMILPLLLEVAIFWQSESFHQSVFGFNAVGYTSQGDFSTIIGSVSFFKIVCCFMVAWPFFVYPQTKNERTKWSLYFCCGVCFSIFGLITWHPQWLIFAAPFWVLSAFINKHLEKFLWLDIAFIVIFYPFVLNAWKGGIDEVIIENGVWKYVIEGTFHSQRMGDYLGFIDNNTLYSALFVLLLIMFVFKHPKYALDDFKQEDGSAYVWLLDLRVLVAALLFIVPAFLCVYESLKSKNDITFAPNPTEWQYILADTVYEQHFTNLDGTIESITFYTATNDRVNNCTIDIQLVEEMSEDILSETTFDGEKVKNLGYTRIDIPDVVVNGNEEYKIIISSKDATTENCIGFGVELGTDSQNIVFSLVSDRQQEYNFSMILGMKD